MENIVITSRELREKNINANIKNDKIYWHYTSLGNLNLILKYKQIRLSTFSAMNDLREAEVHKNDKCLSFSFCFCNSNTEKIPMWYLYAGITGEGVAIGLTPAKMFMLLNSIENITLTKDSDNKNIENNEKVLNKDDFKFEFGWVYYCKNDQIIKYNRLWYQLTDDVESFYEDNYFIKDYPWEYEKEFRIVVKTKLSLHEDYKFAYIKLDEKIINNLKICLAPEFNYCNIDKILEKYPSIKQWLNSKLLKSKLQMKMDLCNRNKNNIVNNLNQIIDDSNVEKFCEQIKALKYCDIEKEER